MQPTCVKSHPLSPTADHSPRALAASRQKPRLSSARWCLSRLWLAALAASFLPLPSAPAQNAASPEATPPVATTTVGVSTTSSATTAPDPATVPEPRVAPRRIAVSIPPLAWFAERAFPEATVTVVLPAGGDPHTFAPSPSQVRQITEADLWLGVGMPFERILHRILPAATAPLFLDFLALQNGSGGTSPTAHRNDDQDHRGQKQSHPPGDTDPHVWLSLDFHQLVAAELQRHYGPAAQLDWLPEAEAAVSIATTLLEPLRGRAFYVQHPAFGALGQRFALRQVAIEVNGRIPPPRQLRRLLATMDAADVHALLVQPRASRAIAETIAAASARPLRLIEVDPLAADWPLLIVEAAEAIADSHQPQAH